MTNGAPLWAWPGTGVGAKTLGQTGAVFMPQISFSAPLFAAVEPEVTVGLGVNSGGLTAETVEMINRFSFGLRWFVPVDNVTAFDVDEPVRPFLWTAIHHGHKVPVAHVLANPVGATLTSTDAGVGHLTGLEGGVGVLLGLPIDGQSFPVLLRVSGSWLPSFASVHDKAHGGDDVFVLVDLAVGLPLRILD